MELGMDNELIALVSLGFGFLWSEVLPFIKDVKSNGILHGLYLKLKEWSEKKDAHS